MSSSSQRQTTMGSSLFILLLSFLFTSIPSTEATSCNPDDYKVLMQIKTALNNPSFLASSWLPNTDCCNWEGVQCDPETTTSRVNSLTIASRSITTQIPSVVGDLAYLQTLSFRKPSNVIIRTIPQSISKLKDLRLLEITQANAIGPIPSFLSGLHDLRYVDLSHNQLTGTIPPSLSQLTGLYALVFSYNNLTGSIPDSFGHFTGLVPDLQFAHNKLSGRIPESFGGLDFNMDLSRNKLTGDASMLFKLNGSSQTINLSQNMFEFNLSKLEFQKSLTSLDLRQNKIYGSLPTELTGLENLKVFNVSYNRLCGEIPSGGKLQTFDSSAYDHNQCLCSPPLNACK